MPSIARLTVALFTLALLHGCDRSGSGDADPDNEGDETIDDGNGESPRGAALELTEKRLQAYIAYRKEFNIVTRTLIAELANLGAKANEKSTDLTKSIAAVQGMGQIGEQHDRTLKALRKKYGFEEQEDERIFSAISDVVAAKPMENPALESQIKTYREMQSKANSAEEKQVADDFFKGMQATEKEDLEKAREQYGAECVDLLSRHIKELYALQMDGAERLTEAFTPGK